MFKSEILVLSAALLMSMALTACGSKSEFHDTIVGADDAGSTTETTAAVRDNTAKDTKLHLVNGEHTYTIIYDKDMSKNAVSACKELNEYLGGNLTLANDEKEASFGEYEILLGATNRPESTEQAEGLGMFDYSITIQNEKLVVVGGSEDAFINAITYLVRGDDLGAEGSIARNYSAFFDGADNRDEYIANPDLFLCRWALKFDVPEWMNNFEEKIAAFADTDGRMMSCSHRGDSVYYPENSIEGIISAMKMGIDIIEIDVHLTSDGVAVLMHDTTLTDTTDWKEKAGQNGLPTSDKICDWTFEQIRQLRLVTKSGAASDYVIPTLKEALQVCNERTTLRLDKADEWDWDTDVYPLVKETGAWRTCIINEYVSLEKQTEIMDTIKTDSGKDALMFYRYPAFESEKWLSLTESLLGQGYQPIGQWVGFDNSGEWYLREYESLLSLIKDDIRMLAFSHALDGGKEDSKTWDYLYGYGVDIVVADDALNLQQYIAENYEATEY